MSRLNIIKRAILIEVMLIILSVSVNGMVVQIREASTYGREKKAKEEITKEAGDLHMNSDSAFDSSFEAEEKALEQKDEEDEK